MTDPDFHGALRAALGDRGAAILLDGIAAGPETAFVGGWVRDTLRGQASGDVDVSTAEPEALKDAMIGAGAKRAVCLDAERGTWRVILPHGLFVDVCALKADSLDADLRARDLTLNAIAWVPGRGIVDPLGGAGDLAAGVLRLASPSAITDDPLRALRVVRFAMRLGMHPPEALLEELRRADLSRIAHERIRAELVSILGGPAPWRGIGLLDAAGLLSVLPPCDRARVAEAKEVDRDSPAIKRLHDHIAREADGTLALTLGLLLAPLDVPDLTDRRWSRKLAQRVVLVANTPLDAAPAPSDRARAEQLVAWKCGAAFVLAVLAVRGGEASVAPYLALLDDAPGFRNPKALPVPPLPKPLLPGNRVQAHVGTGPQIADTLDAMMVEQLLGTITTVEAAEACLAAR